MSAELLDAFLPFLPFWEEASSLALEDQVEAWRADYIGAWPDLRQMLLDDYAAQGLDWRHVAAERVFPHLSDRLPLMMAAHDSLRDHLRPTFARVQGKLGFDAAVVFVLYVGIGNGAGWATRFRDKPAVLFGLENIAELEWHEPVTIQGLIAHELGHIAHALWRAQRGLGDGEGPWWQLYEEGFAQSCEVTVQGGWHEALGFGSDEWLDWCRANKAFLARAFLRSVDDAAQVRRFFGSWYDVAGKPQTGYFLGYEVVRELQAGASLEEIALLQDVEAVCRPLLAKMAQDG